MKVEKIYYYKEGDGTVKVQKTRYNRKYQKRGRPSILSDSEKRLFKTLKDRGYTIKQLSQRFKIKYITCFKIYKKI